jgi:sugar O-acyltransferase (sialic acid O-acetyltransferase NeuD family)
MKIDILIFGTGEIAELAHFYMSRDSNYNIVAFTADRIFIKEEKFLGKPLIAFEDVQELYPPSKFSMHVALSYAKLNQIRTRKYFEAKNKGYILVSYICSKSVFWDDISIGDNCFILENQTIQPTVKIGNNVMIWSGNHLGHGCIIKDHTYISSHICISGHTVIGESCFVGVNATFKDFVTVGNRVFIGMGAMITKNIDNDSVVLGAKSSIYEADNEAAVKLKKIYFNI